MSARLVTLFPQPLSPTIESVSPSSTEKLTRSIARTTPRWVSNVTVSSRTSRSAMALLLETRVERVAEPVAEQVKAEDDEQDAETWRRHEHGRALDEGPRVGEHGAPLGRGRLGAEA